MSAAKRLASTIVKDTPEDAMAPLLRAIERTRLYVGSTNGVTSKHLDVIQRAAQEAILSMEELVRKHREAGEAFAHQNLMRFKYDGE